ncbi:MAG: ParB/RepB/Spo0J family partition protein [Prochloraceae cyanobacterium]|nr:ParB/RepB/Spo0J family partition protein [Prochloraceae cyanobacterium]
MTRKILKFKDFLDSEPETSSESSIPIEEIIVPATQVRHYFDVEKLKQLASSIAQHGVLEPLLLTRKKELIAGERRLRAAKMAGLTEVPVKFLDVSPEIAKTIAIVENLQREDLNPVEETEGILELLRLKLNRSKKDVISLLYKMNKGDDNVIIQEVQIVKDTFESLGKLKWESFVVNRLRLLNLPSSILEAIKQGQIEYTKGSTIARVKDEEFREQLLEETIAQQLSLNEIKAKIARHKGQCRKDYSQLSTEELISDIRQTYQKFTRSKKLWSERKNRKKIESLLEQLKSLTESS